MKGLENMGIEENVVAFVIFYGKLITWKSVVIENYEFERGALMKRTFGKILSFALVLAMLLAMVPAVLAATTESLYLAPGETKTVSCENAKYWRSANDSAVRVAGGSDGTATITAVASSSSYYGYSATISAYEKASDVNS